PHAIPTQVCVFSMQRKQLLDRFLERVDVKLTNSHRRRVAGLHKEDGHTPTPSGTACAVPLAFPADPSPWLLSKVPVAIGCGVFPLRGQAAFDLSENLVGS